MRINLHIPELPERFKKLLCEMVGTFYLVLTISMTLQQRVVDAPIAIGFMLMTQVFAYGYISGGHFNPAVTAGLTLCSLLEVGEMLQYWAAQLVGGFLASMLSWFLVGVDVFFVAPQPISSKGINIFRAFVSEMVFTASLVSVVLNVACSKQKNNHHYGLAIGCSLLCAVFAVGGISGGAFNPAVATSLHVVKCMAHDCTAIKYNPVYWAADLTGSLLAAVLFCLIHSIERSHLPNQQIAYRQGNDHGRGGGEREPLCSVQQESFVGGDRYGSSEVSIAAVQDKVTIGVNHDYNNKAFDSAWCSAVCGKKWKADLDAATRMRAHVTKSGDGCLTLRTAAPLPRCLPSLPRMADSSRSQQDQSQPVYRVVIEAYGPGNHCHLGFVPNHQCAFAARNAATAITPMKGHRIRNYGGWYIDVHASMAGATPSVDDEKYTGWIVLEPSRGAAGDAAGFDTSAYATTTKVPPVPPGSAVEFAVDYTAGTCRVAFYTPAAVAGGFVAAPYAKMELRFVATEATGTVPVRSVPALADSGVELYPAAETAYAGTIWRFVS